MYDQLSFTISTERYLQAPPPPITRNMIWAASFNSTASTYNDINSFAPESIGNVNVYDYVKPMVHVFDSVDNGAYNLSTASQFIARSARFPYITQKLAELPSGQRMLFLKRYQSGPFYGNTLDRIDQDPNKKQLPWADFEGATVETDWRQVAQELKNNGAEPDYIILASEQIGYSTTGFRAKFNTADVTTRGFTFTVFGITSDARYTQPWHTSPSFYNMITDYGAFPIDFKYLTDPTGNGQPHPQFRKHYIYWDRGIYSLFGAFLNRYIVQPGKEIFPNAKFSNYLGEEIIPDDNVFDENGHNYYYSGVVGDSPSPVLYAGINFTSVYAIFNDDPTQIIRTDYSPKQTALVSNAWNQVLQLVNRQRGTKRGSPNSPIHPWIASKYYTSNTYKSYWMDNEINENLYYEVIRHVALTSTEVFLYWNQGESAYPGDNTQERLNDSCSKLNDVLADINSVLGGFTTTSATTERLSYNAKYIISGAPRSAGGYIWRITPRPGVILQDSNGSVLVTEPGGGIWIQTNTSQQPVVTEYSPASQIAARRGTDLARRYYEVSYISNPSNSSYSGWVSSVQRTFYGVPQINYGEAEDIGGLGITRAYNFEYNPTNPSTSSPWHNILYERFNQGYANGFRAISINFPFGSYEHSWLLQPLIWLDTYNSTTNPEQCQARVKGFTGAVKQILDGNMVPNGRSIAINESCDVHLYLPGANGWHPYREKLHDWWTASANTPAARDEALRTKLDEFVDFITSMKSTSGILSVSFDVGRLAATPSTLGLARTFNDYKSDMCELATWYVATKLEIAGIPVLVESRPTSSSRRIQTNGTGATYTAAGITTANDWRNFSSGENWMWASDPERAEARGDYSFSGSDFYGQKFIRNEDAKWVHRLHGSYLANGTKLPYGITTIIDYAGATKELENYGSSVYTPQHMMSQIYGCADMYIDYLYRSTGSVNGVLAERRRFKGFSTYAIDPSIICGYRTLQPGQMFNQYTWRTNNLNNYMPLFGATGFTANPSTYSGGFWTDSTTVGGDTKTWFRTNVMGTDFTKLKDVFLDLAVNYVPPGAQNPNSLPVWGQDYYYNNTIDPILRGS